MAKFTHEIDIDAPMQSVYGILTDPTKWPEWFPDVDSVSDMNEVSQGASIQLRSGERSGRASFTKAQPNELVGIRLDVGGNKSDHTFRLRPGGGILGIGGNDTHLEYTFEYRAKGGLIGEFLAGGNPGDVMKAKKTAEAIKDMAEH